MWTILTSDSAASWVSSPWSASAAAAEELSAETDTADGLPPPTSSILILSNEDSQSTLSVVHGQLEITQSVGSSHAARDPYFCTISNAPVYRAKINVTVCTRSSDRMKRD